MASYFASPKVVLSPDNVIRINADHTKAVEKLITNREQTYKLFGEVDVERLLTLCYLSLGILDDEGKIVGAIILHTNPNLIALPASEWSHWIETKYSIVDATSRNTLWIHLVVYDPAYTRVFMKPMMHKLFKLRNFLNYAIILVPPGRHKLDFSYELGVTVIPLEERKGLSQYLLLFCRSNFCIPYKIRRAVEEDNDDLVPLIQSYSKRFTELYGDYYIAEILMGSKELGRQIIVAEYQGSAVAVLCLSSTVNYQALNEDFDLVPFNGLKKAHPDDFADMDFEFTRTTDVSKTSKIKPTSEEEIGEIIVKKLDSQPKVEEDYVEEEELFHISSSDSEQYSLVFTSASMFVFQDDEEYEGRGSMLDEPHSTSSSAIISQYLSMSDRKQSSREADEHADLISAYSATKFLLQRGPEFKGEDNAFALEIAASLPNHEYGIVELFDAAFECFPDRDYCVMAVPHTIPINKLTKYFGRVSPKSVGTFPAELYVMHRNSMCGIINVETAYKEHELQVKQLISTIPNSPMVAQQFDDYLNMINSPYYAYLCICENQVVGLAMVSEETDLDYIISHYDLSVFNMKQYRSGSHGLIESILLSPIFQRHEKYFLREIHRLSEFDILYHKHSPYDSSEVYRERPLVNILTNFLLIMPVTQPQYDLNILKEEDCAPADVVLEKKEPYALYVCTVPLCSLSKHEINTRIVVIGCSHTAISFLESLLFKQTANYMITYNNVSLICSNGLSHHRVSPKIRESFMVKKNFLDSRWMDMINFKMYINLVQGKLSKIDRKEQCVLINGNTFLDYDLLFLMTGEQFQKPTGPNKEPFQEKPDNVLIINNSLDAYNATIKLKHFYHKYNDNNYIIIIYGHFLQAHATIFGLINFGIPGSHLVLIEPFPYSMALEKRQRHNVSIYNDPEIDAVIYENIRNEGIKIYSSFYFIDWNLDPDYNVITKAKFESKHKMLEVECMAMFFFNEKEVSPRIYRVINNAGLVYDGRLVIDANCRTNDPNIYGAGTLTKYSRRYYAPNMCQKFFNRVEIGKRLGIQIREMLVQQKMQKWDQEASAGWNFHIERGDSLVPRYCEPILRSCRLPGGLYYLSVTKPGKRIPLETAVCMENYGQVLITGNCRNLTKQGYFQLHLNQFKRVETITCLNKFPIDVYNIYCLWGKHEKLLNNLTLRFEMVLITDLYEFFKEPWAYAIYHDKFEQLLDDLNMLMTSSVGLYGEDSLINELISLYKQSKWRKLSKESKDILEEKFRSLAYPKIIENKVLAFIKRNLRHLPMYAHPVVIREILRNYINSPMFS